MLRTTVIGNWPLPPRYAEGLLRYQRGEMREWEAEPILLAAARITLREQRATGVAQMNASGVFTDDFFGHLPRYLTGIETVRSQEAAGSGSSGGLFYRVAGPLEAPRGLGYAAAFMRDAGLDSDLAKASCPGPMTLLSFLLLADPSALSAMPAAVEIVQREVRALVQAGAREVQLDALTEVSALQLFSYEPRAVADAIGGAFHGLRNIVRTVHFCFNGLTGTSFKPEQNFEKLLAVIERLSGRVDKVVIDCADAEVRALLNLIPSSFEVVAGIATVDGEQRQPVDLLVKRTREVLQHVPLERLWLSPACGLRSCSRERAVGILTNLVAAARRF